MNGSYSKFQSLIFILLFGASFVCADDPQTIPLVPLGRLTVAETITGDDFGNSAAIDGDFAVVAARLREVNGVNDVGAVYVFKRDTSVQTNGGWSLLWKLTPPGTMPASTHFGTAVAIKGRTIAVGAPGPFGTGLPRERVYIYDIPNPVPASPPTPVIIDKPCSGNFGDQCCFPSFLPNTSGCSAGPGLGDITMRRFGAVLALDKDPNGGNTVLAVSDTNSRLRIANAIGTLRSWYSTAYLYTRASTTSTWIRRADTYYIGYIDGGSYGYETTFGANLAVKNNWNGSSYANSVLAVGAPNYVQGGQLKGTVGFFHFGTGQVYAMYGPVPAQGRPIGGGGIAFNTDGTKALAGTNDNKVYAYIFSSGWNLAQTILNPLNPPTLTFFSSPAIDGNLSLISSLAYPAMGSALVFGLESANSEENPPPLEWVSKRQISTPPDEPYFSSTTEFGEVLAASQGSQLVCARGDGFPGFCYVYNCAGDTDGGGYIDFIDLNVVLSSFGSSCVGCPADVNRDRVVDFLDLNTVLSAFGYRCAPDVP